MDISKIKIMDVVKFINKRYGNRKSDKNQSNKENVIFTMDSEEYLYRYIHLIKENKIDEIAVVKNNETIKIIDKNDVITFLYNTIYENNIIFKYIFNNIHEAVCVLDKEGKVVIWNNKAEKLYGIKEEEIKGQKLKKYFPEAIDEKILKTLKKVENIYHTPKKGVNIIISASPIIVRGEVIGVVSTDRNISEIQKLTEELNRANETVEFLKDEMRKMTKKDFGDVIGESNKIIKKIEVAKQVARSNASILLTGESGTGKEVFARSIHKSSGVKGNFVPINCSAIPGELFESEFFGYEEGAFTGAKKTGKIGYFELANKGTIFLDEIGDLPIPMQAKLLRVLQDKKIKPIGSDKYIDVDFRVISATNKNLEELIDKEEFREDLYYRLNVIKIKLPPLRERKEDIILFIEYFIKKFCKENNRFIPQIDKEVIDILLEYEWEGNVREVKNIIEHMLVLCKGNRITKELLPKYIINNVFKENDSSDYITKCSFGLNESVKKLEISLIKKALQLSKGNKSEAAKILNIPRTTLHSKMKKYEIEE